MKGSFDTSFCYDGQNIKLVGFWIAGDQDKRRSSIGYVLYLADDGVSCISKLESVIAFSTTKAEYMSVKHACEEVSG